MYVWTCARVHFSGRSSAVFITFPKEIMTHKRLRTAQVQAPHIRGEEIESKEENECLSSHSQDQEPRFLDTILPCLVP